MTPSNLLRFASLVVALAPIASANIYGSDPTAPLPTLDTCSGCVFAYVNFPGGAAGQSVLSYQFYNGAGQGTSNNLTPLLFQQVAPRTFDIIGIGTTSTGFNAGYNTVPFGLSQGSATIINGNTWFGYVDGTTTGAGNTGTIVSNYPTGPGSTTFFSEPSGPLTVGKALTVFAFTDTPFPNQNDRTYSLQVTTSANTPEPGFYGLLALGFGALMVAARRRAA